MGNVLGILVGAFFAINGIVHWTKLLRRQSRLQKATAVFVGTDDRLMHDPQVRSRAGRFRFVTADGRTIERTSSFSSFPGPKPGQQVTVVYDPEKPETTAERAGVHRFLLMAGGPIFIVVGIAVIIVNVGML